MSQDVSTAAQQEAVVRLYELAAESTRQQEQMSSEHGQRVAQAQADFATSDQRLSEQGEQRLDALNTELTERLESARLTFEGQLEDLQELRNTKSDEALRQRTEQVTAAQQDCEATLFQLADHVVQDRNSAAEKHEQLLQRCETAETELQEVVEAADRFWDRRGLDLAAVPPTASAANEWSSILLRKAAEARTG